MDRFLRPKAEILPETALVPAPEAGTSGPGRFTHVLVKEQPFHWTDGAPDRSPDGRLAAGTNVVFVAREPSGRCRVLDSQCRQMVTDFEGLQPL